MSEKKYVLSRDSSPVKAQIKLVSSKSESNRALIINAVSGGKCELDNLSAARDTQTMQRLLGLSTQELDVLEMCFWVYKLEVLAKTSFLLFTLSPFFCK